jgi:hypothetical protein
MNKLLEVSLEEQEKGLNDFSDTLQFLSIHLKQLSNDTLLTFDSYIIFLDFDHYVNDPFNHILYRHFGPFFK